MTERTEQFYSVTNRVLIAWGIPLILAMLSLITFFVHDLYIDYKKRITGVEQRTQQLDTRVTVLEILEKSN